MQDNDCENLCKSICCLCGKIIGQDRVDIPDLVIPISLRATMNLKLTTYYLSYLDNISMPIGATNVILPLVRLIISLKELQ